MVLYQKLIAMDNNLISYRTLLLVFILIKALLIASFISTEAIGLGPDEAQYWTWSRTLDWGYYSKPPGIAWQIWLGTMGWGQTELGVRFFSLLFSVAQSISVYFLACRAGLKPLTAFWSGLIMAFSPIGLIGSLFAITDAGLLFFWTLACIEMVSALNERREADPIKIGYCILFGALFKWPIYWFWVFFFGFRKWKFSTLPLWKSLAGVGLSLMGLLPSIWWNWSHDWATFRHVGATLQGGSAAAAGHGNFFEFLGAQTFLLSPIWFGLLLMAYWDWGKRCSNFPPPLAFCGLVSFISLAFLAIAALFQKVQGNWAIFAYPTGVVLLSWTAIERQPKRTKWLKRGFVLSVSLIGLGILFLSSVPYPLNPFKHNRGWMELRKVLDDIGYDSKEHFLVSDKYQTTSLLSFYNTGQKRAYFLNLQGMRNNQFSYWGNLQEEEKEKDGYFVWVENAPHLKNWERKFNFYQTELLNYFENVEFLGLHPLLYQETEIVKAAFIFKCQNCYDKKPDESNLY